MRPFLKNLLFNFLFFSTSFLYLLFFINLLRKSKRKQNFPMSLHRKYYKKRATVITYFFTFLFLFYFYFIFYKNNRKNKIK
jgi:hypothetical protein